MRRSKYQSWQRRTLSELDRKMLSLIVKHWRAGHPIDRDSAEFELVQQGHAYRDVHEVIPRFINEAPALMNAGYQLPSPSLAGLVELGDEPSEEDLEKLVLLIQALRALYHPTRRQHSVETVSQHSGVPPEDVQRLAGFTTFLGSEGFILSNHILGWESFEDFLDQQLVAPPRDEPDEKALPDLEIGFLASALRWSNLGPYRQAKLELSPLTVLVGANAAGKTSALRALEWMRDLALRGPEAIDSQAIIHRDSTTAGISISGELRKREHLWTTAVWSAALSLRPRVAVQHERLQLGITSPRAELELGIGHWSGTDGRLEPLHLRSNQLALLEARDPQRHAALIAMRQSMRRWWIKTERVTEREDLYPLLEEVPEPDLQEKVEAVLGPVQVKRTGRQQWVFIDPRKYETELSAAPRGILQVVFLLAHLLHPRRPSLLAFDEIENHLHADVVERLIDVMRSYTDRTRIVLTTHSGNVLRLMDPSEVRLVRMEKDGSTIVRVDQDPVLKQLAKTGDMAKLLEDGFFAGGL